MDAPPGPLNLSLQILDVVGVDGHASFEGFAHGLPEVDHGCQQECRPAQTVAALYVDPKGVYANLPDVEVWDEARDARQYGGPYPVVAHPPCAAWCRWAALRERDGYGRRGDDGGMFESA